MRKITLQILLFSIILTQGRTDTVVSPEQWPDRDEYLAREAARIPGQPATENLHAGKAMIVGMTNPLAVHAGLEALKRGGSAADAVLTTALAQIALNAGATVSYAGILTAVY